MRVRPPKPDSFDRRLYAPMILGAGMNPLNSSIIAVSLIPIGKAFDAPPAHVAWLVSSLYLATAIGQPLLGRLVDALGPRRVYLIGTSLAGVSGFMGLFAPSLGVLIAARVVLGFATCAGYPSAMYLIREEARRTGRDSPAAALTALSLANQTIAVVGPTLGGLLIGLSGWRSTFAINIPLSIACVTLGALFLPRTRTDSARKRAPLDLDASGMALFSMTLVALLLYLTSPTARNWWLAVLAGVALGAFVWWELRTRTPFLDVRALAASPALLATFLRQLLSGLLSYTFLYGFTQWLESGAGYSASQAGLLLIPMFGTAIVVTAITGRRREVRLKLLVGSALQVICSVLLLFAGASGPLWLLLVVVFVMGFPQGTVSLANQNALYSQADPQRIASSAGLLRTFLYLGAILSSTASGAFLGDASGDDSLHSLAWFMVAVSVAFLVLTILDRSLGRLDRRTRDEQAAERPTIAVASR